MITCGIEIKGSEAIFVVLQTDKHGVKDVTGNFKKLKLENSENCKEVKSFLETIRAHLQLVNPERIGIVKRNKKGKFSGGADTFKIEGLIQLYETRNVKMVSPHTLRKFEKEKKPILPSMNKYQQGACVLAMYLLEK